LSDDSVRDDVTSSGRLFHVLAAVMGNARLPVLPSRVEYWWYSNTHCSLYSPLCSLCSLLLFFMWLIDQLSVVILISPQSIQCLSHVAVLFVFMLYLFSLI